MHELQKHMLRGRNQLQKITYCESVYQKCSELVNLETVNRLEAA